MDILALVVFAFAAQGLREKYDAKIAIPGEFSAVAVAPAAEAAAEAAALSEISSQIVPLGSNPVEEANVAPAEGNTPSEPEALLEEEQRLKEESAVGEEDLAGAAADLGRVTKQMREGTELADTVKDDAIVNPRLPAAFKRAVNRAIAGSHAFTRKGAPRVAPARAHTIRDAGVKIAKGSPFTTVSGRGAGLGALGHAMADLLADDEEARREQKKAGLMADDEEAQQDERKQKPYLKKKQNARRSASAPKNAEFWGKIALTMENGEEEVATLIKSLWNAPWEDYIKAAQALGKLTDPSKIASLSASLALTDKFQEQILTLIDELYDPDDEYEQSRMVAAGALAEALGSLDATKEGKLALEKALDEGYWMLRLKAAEALGENGDSDSVPALARALYGDSGKRHSRDSELRVQKAAARALGKIGDAASVKALDKAATAVEPWLFPWNTPSVERSRRSPPMQRPRIAAIKALKEIVQAAKAVEPWPFPGNMPSVERSLSLDTIGPALSAMAALRRVATDMYDEETEPRNAAIEALSVIGSVAE